MQYWITPRSELRQMIKKQATVNMEPPQFGKYSVPIVRSTFRILEELSRVEALGLKEITQVTGLAKSTVFRILSTLLDMGYLARDADRNYRISFTLGNLVSEQSINETLRRLALPHMLDFATSTER